MICYVESSAAVKLLVQEAESDALAAHLDERAGEHTIMSCLLVETELRRFAVRVGVSQEAVSAVLAGITLLEPDRALYRTAGLLPGPHMRSLDALHVAAALQLQADVMLTYDHRQAEAARWSGLSTASPR
ncbi:MAG: type II toxin-antitoxin system VapC family toxin [Mycobacteriaceae bacterium]